MTEPMRQYLLMTGFCKTHGACNDEQCKGCQDARRREREFDLKLAQEGYAGQDASKFLPNTQKVQVKTIDKAAIEAAEEMLTYPNTNWDYPNKRDEVLAVARQCIKSTEQIKAERKKAKALRAELKKTKRLLKKASDWLESANTIIQDGPDAEEGDDEDAKAFIEELREVAS